MIGGYYVAGLAGRATFDLFVRQLPATRNFLVTAGLEQALDFLSRFVSPGKRSISSGPFRPSRIFHAPSSTTTFRLSALPATSGR
jgi:nicotinic acid phosphoribosyltransferase